MSIKKILKRPRENLLQEAHENGLMSSCLRKRTGLKAALKPMSGILNGDCDNLTDELMVFCRI